MPIHRLPSGVSANEVIWLFEQPGRVVAGENRERQSIETREALQRAHPEVAVPRLEDLPDRIVREAILGVPMAGDVVGGLFRRIEREGARGGKRGGQQQQPGKWNFPPELAGPISGARFNFADEWICFHEFHGVSGGL